jgi:electron transfer flavoprotein alpha subunit
VSVLVFVEHHGNQLQKGSLGVLTKAASLGAGDVAAVLVGGPSVEGLASEVGQFGASTVYVAAADTLEAPLPQPRVDVIAGVVHAGGFDTVLFSNSVLAADIASGLAARLEAGVNWDLVDIEVTDGRPVAKRLALGDAVLVDAPPSASGSSGPARSTRRRWVATSPRSSGSTSSCNRTRRWPP